jgi:outer membrane protein assembly factor BamB
MRLHICCALSSAVLMLSGLAPAAVAAADRPGDCEWPQWGQNPAHTGQTCARGQHGLRLLTRLVVDPFAEQEDAEAGGIPVHYPVPLTDGDGNVFVLEKGGSYVSCDPPGSGEPAPCGLDPGNVVRQTWSLRALRWRNDRLAPAWRFTSDWKPNPSGVEATFQSALSGDGIFVPGAGGTVFQLAKSNGRVLRRINPFGRTVDPAAFITGGLTVDGRGNLFYNVMRLEPAPDGGQDTHGWLVRVSRNGTTNMVDYGTLIPAAPRPTDLCYTSFPFDPQGPQLPPPPQPDGSPTLTPQVPCGSQRAGLGVTPAIGPDGTIVTVTRTSAFNTPYYGFIVALNPDLSLKWASSLRGLINDGCGVLTPYGDQFGECRPGAAFGVDPFTNLQPAPGVSDDSSSAPVILPDGGVLYGARNLYNNVRGHLVKFDRTGRFQGTFDFGWDLTPGVYRHDGTYSLIIKDNHYFTGPFGLTRLDAGLNIEWTRANTETRTCVRGTDGTVTCVDDGTHPDGFEWCVNAPAIDRDGNVYGLSEDGNLYVLDSQGHQRERVFLSKTVASAYTPLSLDPSGRIYAQNNGELYILGH